jgi:DNA-binding transcriptional LysR family regulator
MSLENFRVFYEAVRLKSFRQAANSLNVAPSSISRQIAVLERQIGTSLFDRSANGVVVTHAGEMVAEFARNLLIDYGALKTDLDDYRGGRRAFIRLALVEGMSAAGSGRAIRRLHDRFELVRFSIRMVPAPKVVELVKNGEVDIGLTFTPQMDDDLKTAAKIPEPLVLVRNESGTQKTITGASLSDLANQPIALPTANFGIRTILDTACESAGFKLTPVLESDSFEVLRDFAIAGCGATVLPQRALKGKDNSGLSIAAITDRRLKRTTIDVVLLKHRRLPRIVRLFLDGLVEEIAS